MCRPANTVLVRIVNAGLKMHVPSIVGSQTTGFSGAGATGTTVNGFTLIAEDGNPVPGAPRVQTDVFMAAGKTYDVMINLPTLHTPWFAGDHLRARGRARLRPRTEPVRQPDRPRCRHARVHRRQWRALPTGAAAGAFSASANAPAGESGHYNSVLQARR